MQKEPAPGTPRPRGLETRVVLALACWVMALTATLFSLVERRSFRQDVAGLIELFYLGCVVLGASFWFSPRVLVVAYPALPHAGRVAGQSLDGFLLLASGIGAVGSMMAGWLQGLLTRQWILPRLEASFGHRQIAAGCAASLVGAPLVQFLAMGLLGL